MNLQKSEVQAANKEVKMVGLGLVDYKQAWDYQEELFKGIIDLKIENRGLDGDSKRPTPNYLIICEHPHVFTLGKSGSEDNLLIKRTDLQTIDADYYPINRGGDITYHGPGQLVIYPILDLDNFFTDIHKYLRFLEEAVILTLNDYGITSGRIDGLTGVWLDHEKQRNPRKICAMGVKSSRWVTMHGLALNVNTDLGYFNHIVPCGIEDKAVTSIKKETGREIALAEVAEKMTKNIASLFGMKLIS